MTFAIKWIIDRGAIAVTLLMASLFVQPALAGNGELTSIEASRYPVEALRLADSQIPELASAIAACDADSARQIRDKVTTFIYKTWNWNAHYEKLKDYRACFQLLSDVAAGTQLASKHGGVSPRHIVGLLDANYASCQKVADPNATPPAVDPQLHWPRKLGNEPQSGHCRAINAR